MGNRKKMIEAQKIFDEFGWGKFHRKEIRRFSDQLKPKTLFTVLEYYKLGTVYDSFLHCNDTIDHWAGPLTYNYDTYSRVTKKYGQMYRYMALGNIYFSCGTWVDQHDIEYWKEKGGFDLPKPRIEIEKLLLSNKYLWPHVRKILENGGHVHDENGFMLPEMMEDPPSTFSSIGFKHPFFGT